MTSKIASQQNQLESLPVPLAERTWSGYTALAVCLMFSVGSWSFVVVGFVAYWLDAVTGTAAIISGALIAQFFLTLSQARITARYGIETVASTKPQLGIRGSYLTLLIQYIAEVGWTAVLLVFLGRSTARVMSISGLIGDHSFDTVSIISSVMAAVLVWCILQAGPKGMKYLSIIAIAVVGLIGFWACYTLFHTYGIDRVVNAKPIAPKDDDLTNFMLSFELLAVSTISWWPSMGGVFRMVKSPRSTMIPSVVGLGLGWALFGLISLYSALVLNEADPTIWMANLAGPVAGMAALTMIIFANLGSSLTMCYVGSVGIGQAPLLRNGASWRFRTLFLVVPVIVIVIVIPDLFYDKISTYISFMGTLIAPMVGIQIADWYIIRRKLHVSSLFRYNSRSAYWYIGGINPAGVIGLIIGCLTYLLLINPITFVPKTYLFNYMGGTVPSILISGLSYVLATWLLDIKASTELNDESITQ